MKFTFAITAEAVKKAWIESGVVLDPTFTVEVPDADLPQIVRETYTVGEVSFARDTTVDGRIRTCAPISHSAGHYAVDPVQAPSFPAPVEADEAMEAVALYIAACRAADAKVRALRAEREEHAAKERVKLREQQEHIRAREEAAREQAAAAKAAYDAERSAWIAAHGSARLRMLAAEGLGLDRTYRAERLAAERPGGWAWESETCGELVGLRDASQESLDALIAARAVAPDAKLAYLSDSAHVEDCDHGYGEDFKERPILRAEFLGREIVREI